MEGEAWFFLLLVLVIIPGGVLALVARRHPEGVGRISEAVRAYLVSLKDAKGIYVRTWRDVRRLGWWVVLPAAIFIPNLVYCAIRDMSLPLEAGPWLNRFYFDYGIQHSSLRWESIGKIFSAGGRMDTAFFTPVFNLGGTIFLWLLLAFSVDVIAWRRERIRGAEAWFAIFLVLYANILLTLYICFPTVLSHSGRYPIHLSIDLVLFPFWFSLGVRWFRWKLGAEPLSIGSIAGRFTNTLLPFVLLDLILCLRSIVLWGFESFATGTEYWKIFGYGTPLNEITGWVLTSFGIFLIPLFIALASFGWDLKATWNNARNLYRDRASALLLAIPLFWAPFLVIELARWLAGFAIDYREPWTLWLSIAIGIVWKISIPLLSLFPLCYLYRVVEDWGNADPALSGKAVTPPGEPAPAVPEAASTRPVDR